MESRGEIKGEKILVREMFSNMWYRIPEYQRPYVWGHDEINSLLEDLYFAMKTKPNCEYFLGSFVLHSKSENSERDLLDGQQRMITLLLLFAVLRDSTEDGEEKAACQRCIYQEPNALLRIPEQTRITFAIRGEADEFIENYIKKCGGTSSDEDIANLSHKAKDLSVRNMAKAVIEIRGYFKENSSIGLREFIEFLLNNVLLIYVSTQDLQDAFRLFTILNTRGIPLRNSDILKSMNLGALESAEEKEKYAKMWENAENELDDDFDRFLNHVRTILVKDKARLSLLQEFEDRIYNPKEVDKATGQEKPALLKKGRETFAIIEKYLSHYRNLLGGENKDETGSFEFDNLVKVMLEGLPATDWIPPLLRYFEKYKYNRLLEFLRKLNNKFSAEWICQFTLTDRIKAMNKIIQVIDDAKCADEIFKSDCFSIDIRSFMRELDGPVYGKKFVKYILLMLDYLCHDHRDASMNFATLSVEHILPQDPADNSQWVKSFTFEERTEWKDKLGNLVLISRRKNSSLGRLDYEEKKDKYFGRPINTSPNSLRVLNGYKAWTPKELKENHQFVLQLLQQHYSTNLPG